MYFSGFLRDITGYYDTTFYVAGACIVVAGVLYVALTKAKKHKEDMEEQQEQEVRVTRL